MNSKNRVSNYKIIFVELDDSELPTPSHEAQQERKVAIFDLLENNYFRLINSNELQTYEGPYKLSISIKDQRLIIKISSHKGSLLKEIFLSLSPLRQILRDYMEICSSYYNAVKRLAPSQIETIDMGRRSIHDEGGRILIKRLDGKIELDADTSRRLFTLITALYLEK
jgi:uncharacterized protein (UPF0262 family)